MGAFVVNPRGATHSVPEAWVPDLLTRGYRQATEPEIAAWFAMQGLAPGREENDAASDDGGADQPRARPDRRSRRE